MRIDPVDPELLRLVERTAVATERPSRALHLQALLQMPRIADENGVVGTEHAASIVRALAAEIPTEREFAIERAIELDELSFAPASPDQSSDICARLHYLRSPRDGTAYGLFDRDHVLVALAVASTLDVPNLRLHVGSRAAGTRVLSRVFCKHGTPRNAISLLLRRVAIAERAIGTTDLLTYVNPNMGFHGSSYRASGWTPMGTEPLPHYSYLDDRYVTERRLAAMQESTDSGTRERLEARLTRSRMPLRPLVIFHRRIERMRKGRAQHGTSRSSSRWPPTDSPAAELSPFAYSNWDVGQPDNFGGNQDCARMWSQSTNPAAPETQDSPGTIPTTPPWHAAPPAMDLPR